MKKLINQNDKQPIWWKKNGKTTKMGIKKPAFVVCEKKIIFVFFFFQLEGIWKKMINHPREKFFFFFFSFSFRLK